MWLFQPFLLLWGVWYKTNTNRNMHFLKRKRVSLSPVCSSWDIEFQPFLYFLVLKVLFPLNWQLSQTWQKKFSNPLNYLIFNIRSLIDLTQCCTRDWTQRIEEILIIFRKDITHGFKLFPAHCQTRLLMWIWISAQFAIDWYTTIIIENLIFRIRGRA